MTVIGTAGHVDAGKSTLIQALTGTHPDRWAEERERGLTIDLGFASLTTADGIEVSFVDVPGHVKFLRNMLAGAGGIAGVLFVVAATDGWRAQSDEHLAILNVLGVERAVVVITRVLQVGDDRRGELRAEISDRLSTTRLAGSPIVDADPPSGVGLDEVTEQLASMVRRVPPAPDHRRPRLWIDRSFTIRGAGTVVTGVLSDGAISVGEELVVAPLGASVRVRGLQRHGTVVERAEPGQRVAVNLSGLAHDQIGRGDALVRAGDWHLADTLDVDLQVLDTLDHSVRRTGAYSLHLGTAERSVRLRVIQSDAVAAGSGGAVRLRVDGKVTARPGDRFVLREFGRDETVGGGEVLDVDPQLPTLRATPDRSVRRVVAERGRIQVDHLRRVTGTEPPWDQVEVIGDWAMVADELDRRRVELAERIGASDAGLSLAELDDIDRRLVLDLDGVDRQGDRLVIAGTQLSDAAAQLLSQLDAAGAQPAQPDTSQRAAAAELARAGRIIRCGEFWFAGTAINDVIKVVASEMTGHDSGATPGQLRDALGTTRRFLIPLLEWCDATGRTRRRDDVRIPGPRSGIALEPIDLRQGG